MKKHKRRSVSVSKSEVYWVIWGILGKKEKERSKTMKKEQESNLHYFQAQWYKDGRKFSDHLSRLRETDPLNS